MLYFAYGSNMWSVRLAERITSAQFYDIGWIQNFQLAFHKRSIDGSGKCNIIKTGNLLHQTFGVLYTINDDEISELGKYEGAGEQYHETTLKILTARGSQKALCYIADPGWIQEGLAPYDWYLQFVINGALENNLPSEYIHSLKIVESRPDKNEPRAALNWDLIKSNPTV